MQEDGRYFNEALGRMTAQYAYVDSVNHLTDLGYTLDEIMERLDYPVSRQTVATVMQARLDAGCKKAASEYIVEQDHLGRRTYRKITPSRDSDA